MKAWFLVLLMVFVAAAGQGQMPQGEIPEISLGAQADGQTEGSSLLSNPVAGESALSANPWLRRLHIGTEATYPSLLNSIEAINFNENTALTGFFQIPPDPSGAAGVAHVVDVVNSSIEWFAKSGGAPQNRQSLRTFFGNVPATNTFDPKVVYDPHANRFVVVTLERVGNAVNSPGNASRIFVAVSDDGDPNGVWHTMSIDAKTTIGTTGAAMTPIERWADFPGLAVDEEAIYITANMFAFAAPQPFGGVRLWIIPKAGIYSGGPGTSNIYDPIALANANPEGEGAVATTAQPALVFDAPSGFGTYLMQYSGLNDGANIYLGAIEVRNPVTTPSFVGHFLLIGPFPSFDNLLLGLPPAPQLGSNRTIATNDRRVSNTPIMRDNNLYLAAPMRAPLTAGADADQATVRWFKVDVSDTDAPALVDHGSIGGEQIAAGTHTFFPTVAVNCSGDLAVGFAASGPNIHPGAYFTGRQAADPPGTTNAPGTLRAGLDVYVRAFSTGMTATSRWGDYTGASVDPVDNTFWVFNEYALTGGTIIAQIGPHEQGRWGNAHGRFDLDATAPVISAMSASSTSLSPPNHQLVDVAIAYDVADNSCRPVTCSLAVTSNEAVNGNGDGNTDPDWVVVDDHNVKLRAERSGNGGDRVYTITATCSDSSTNSSSDSVTVTVAHNK